MCTNLFSLMLCHIKQVIGKQKEDYVVEAQSKTKNAQKAALLAAFHYFQSQLDTDESTWEALQVRLAVSYSYSVTEGQ